MMDHFATFYSYVTPLGHVTIMARDGAITRLAFGSCRFDAVERPCEASNIAASQIQEYLAGKRRCFDVPLDLSGTEFQQEVWKGIASIPYGNSLTCSQLASSIGHPGSRRSVGSAVRKNPVPLIVADHRVIGLAGRPDAAIKEFLLNLEQNVGC